MINFAMLFLRFGTISENWVEGNLVFSQKYLRRSGVLCGFQKNGSFFPFPDFVPLRLQLRKRQKVKKNVAVDFHTVTVIKLLQVQRHSGTKHGPAMV